MENKIEIGIHGVPRSGTTWLGQLINSSPNVIYKYQPFFSYEFKDYLNESSSYNEINSFFRKLETAKSNFLDQSDSIDKGIIPCFKKKNATHLVYKEVRYHHIIENMLCQYPSIKIIGIIRNPLATISSWLNSPREFRKDLGWIEMDEWKNAIKKNERRPENFFGFEKWKEVAYLFQSLELKFKDSFHLVVYDELLNDTTTVTKNLFDFCELEFAISTLQFINLSKTTNNDDTYSVFRTKSNDDNWKRFLDKNIAESIVNDLKDTPLVKYL